MVDRNSYLAYKRDTRHLLYWLIHAFNHIIKSSPSSRGVDAAPVQANTTGQLSVSALVPTSNLIAKHVSPIPSTIYHLFQSVIAARTAAGAVFQQIVATKPDPEIERSNVSHKIYIDALTEAFEVLGGELWASKQRSGTDSPDEEDVDDVIFTNQFSALGLDGSDNEEEGEDAVEGGSDGRSTDAPPVRHGTKRTGKSKKGKGRKRGGRKPKPAIKEASIDAVPLESYRIVEDESGLVTDYLMAVYSLVTQWIELRHYVQGLWREVSYNGLNGAVAATLSKMAIAMVKQTESAVFVDFPGHESYDIVMKTITRGDPEKAQGMFGIGLHRVDPNGAVKQVQKTDVDVKEQFLIHAYWDLLDFVTDFQRTRSGKPTKAVLPAIRDWDPNLDLQRASKEQRIKWRRAYTINWLYDLVNIFSSIVVQRNTMHRQNIVLETVDWSVEGPWSEDRRLFGLNDFAGDITSLAMQKPGTDVRKKILPHHVFQLQCIVDSLTVSRGWSLNSLKGHVLSPPAGVFHPRRDVDLFMDRENERMGHGYCNAVDILTQLFGKDAMLHGDPNRHKQQSDILKTLRDDFVNWLGEYKYMHGLTTIPPSRFSSTNSNGLWEYSPFLCGVGLMEALDLAYGMNFLIWDRISEPMSLIHLHNMLVQKQYIKKEVGLYASLQQLFPTAFFIDGKAPTSNFGEAFAEVLSATGSRRAIFQRRTIRQNDSRTARDIHGLLNANANRFFKQKSFLRLYREAQWVPERIPDEEIPPLSSLGMIRIGQTKHAVDPATGKRVLESTDLVSRARSQGLDDQTMMKMSSLLQNNDLMDQIPPEALSAALPEGYQSADIRKHRRGDITDSCRELLSILKLDLTSDVSGQRPVASLNYVWVTVRMMMLFMEIEEELKRLRNPLWVRAYEQDESMMREKRASLAALVLAEEDDECMEVMARVFQNPRAGFMDHIYWEDLDEDASARAKKTDSIDDDEAAAAAACVVM